jgi:hypothetical protein
MPIPSTTIPGTRATYAEPVVTSDVRKSPVQIERAPTETIGLGPSRLYSVPAQNDASANTSIIGSKPAPAPSAERSWIFCRYCGRNMSAAKNVGETSSTERQTNPKRLFRRTSGGRSAPVPPRRSTATNRANRTGEATKSPITSGEPQPISDPRSRASSNETRPSESVPMPR